MFEYPSSGSHAKMEKWWRSSFRYSCRRIFYYINSNILKNSKSLYLGYSFIYSTPTTLSLSLQKCKCCLRLGQETTYSPFPLGHTNEDKALHGAVTKDFRFLIFIGSSAVLGSLPAVILLRDVMPILNSVGNVPCFVPFIKQKDLFLSYYLAFFPG